MEGLTDEEAAIVSLVAEFVDREVRPVARELEQRWKMSHVPWVCDEVGKQIVEMCGRWQVSLRAPISSSYTVA